MKLRLEEKIKIKKKKVNNTMDKFFSLENSNSFITETNNLNEDEEIINNVLEKINLIKYDFVSDIINELVSNAIINDVKINKFQRTELKLINKIYDKFGIIKNLNIFEPIDMVITYVNYNDRTYINGRSSFELKELDPVILSNFKEEKKENMNEFFLNIELTKKNIPFIRNIYIITPNPDYFDEIEKYIIIPIDEICGKDKYNKIYFRPNNIVKYLTEIKNLSNIFLFGNNDMIAIRNIKKEILFNENNIPIIYLQKKKIIKDGSTKSIEEFNTNKLFHSKFDTLLKLSNINQLSIVRKDVIGFTRRLVNSDINCDFLLMQYFVGYYYYLYNIKTENNQNHTGFYSITQKVAIERFNSLKFKKYDYFCVNFLNDKFIPYYLHSCLVNMDIIDNKPVKNIYFLIERGNSKYKYIIPKIEREIKENIGNIKVNFNLLSDENIPINSGKFGDSLYLILGCPEKKWQHIKHIALLINEKSGIGDILYFMNIESKYLSVENNKIIYPKKIMQKLEEKYNIPFLRILRINNDSEGIKTAKLIFSKDIEKLI